MTNDFYQWQGDDLLLSVREQPGASRNEITRLVDHLLRIRLTARPVDGKANTALCRFIAKTFDVSSSQVSLIKGDHSRQKRVLICQPNQLISGIDKNHKPQKMS